MADDNGVPLPPDDADAPPEDDAPFPDGADRCTTASSRTSSTSSAGCQRRAEVGAAIAFHILQTESFDVSRLASLLTDLRERVRFCELCGNITEQERCAICPTRAGARR